MLLFGLILALRPKNILELGVRYGDTTRPMLAAAELVNAELTSVDLNPTEFKSESKHWVFVQGEAISVLSKLVATDRKFDFVFVDDWHDGEHVWQELELIDKMVGPSSIVALHDLMYQNWEPRYHSDQWAGGEWGHGGPAAGVQAFLSARSNQWEMLTIPVQHGLTLLRKIS